MPEDVIKRDADAALLGSDQVARLAFSALLERKGEEVVVLGMVEVLPLTDYFVIATGLNDRHVRALTESVEQELKKRGVLPMNRAGRDARNWVLLDYGGVVVHIFLPDVREYYDLELRWGDAERVEMEPMDLTEPEATA